MKISEILSKYDTDKNREHPYGVVYDEIFSRFDRNTKLNILEIGTYQGESLLAWRDFFPHAKITGIDILDQCPSKKEDIDYVISDINDFRTDQEFDIIIDDGSHWLKDVVHSVAYFTHKLRLNGVMIIEDVQRPEVWIPTIKNILSSQLEYNKDKIFKIETMDFRPFKNQYDDFLIVITYQGVR